MSIYCAYVSVCVCGWVGEGDGESLGFVSDQTNTDVPTIIIVDVSFISCLHLTTNAKKKKQSQSHTFAHTDNRI